MQNVSIGWFSGMMKINLKLKSPKYFTNTVCILNKYYRMKSEGFLYVCITYIIGFTITIHLVLLQFVCACNGKFI